MSIAVNKLLKLQKEMIETADYLRFIAKNPNWTKHAYELLGAASQCGQWAEEIAKEIYTLVDDLD